MPLRDGLSFAVNMLRGFDLKKEIKVIASVTGYPTNIGPYSFASPGYPRFAIIAQLFTLKV